VLVVTTFFGLCFAHEAAVAVGRGVVAVDEVAGRNFL